MTVSGNAKAYPFSAISQETVIDGHFTGEEVVITFDPASESDEAFVWWLRGRVLSFEPAAGWGRGVYVGPGDKKFMAGVDRPSR